MTPADHDHPASEAASAPPPIAEVIGITKRFGALTANDDISFAVQGGEVHALLGENGAGKSTLTRILYGLSQPDAGRIVVDGRPRQFSSPKDARRAGIGMVTQEFSLVGPMTVTENVMLSDVGLGRVDRRDGRRRVADAAQQLGFDLDPDAVVASLSVGEQQRVEIVKALFHECRLLILDEPTAVLVPQDVAALFDTIRRLRSAGVGVVFISHKLREVVEIADQVTVLRRGRRVATQPAAGLDPRQIAALMIGTEAAASDNALAIAIADDEVAAEVGLDVEAADVGPSVAPDGAAVVLRIDSVSASIDGRPALRDVALEVHAGEIVGVAGVSGNGQTELVDVLAGTLRPTAGRIEVSGREVTGMDPRARLRAGLGRISENRKGSVVPTMTVAQTLVLEDLDRFSRFGLLRRADVRRHAQALIDEFDIRAGLDDPIGSLSGGNMQKVLLARALSRRPAALVAAQPTRGLDVGACDFVYSQLRTLRDAGSGVLVISDDLDELFALVDRFVVMVGGRVVGSVDAAVATPESLGLLMMGEAA